ncbi:MmgE/PrpD family protein [Sphingomonas sp. MMS24-J13]|uniref:MmgE/PrpD family protein n=1 Tax=Sphingomonas sp. MMS24-J13 TaxID=3238686 RepID=UPI00384E676E
MLKRVQHDGEGATAAVVRLSRAAARDIPAETLAVAKLCIADFIALALAGSREPVARILHAAALAEGAHPTATALGHGRHFSLRQAALINGAAGHALDYDDVALAMHVHPTTVLLPPLLALAEARRASGRQLIAAFVAAYEAAGMIGAWLGAAPYERGFHMTGTVGAIGAAMGAAYLIGLDERATARALGLAATQAAGLKAQFGTMAKPLHAGRAAETGLLAALWAEAGLTGRADMLEARQGFAETQSHLPDRAIVWDGYQLDHNSFKFHAACFGVQGTIEAIAALRRAGLRADAVAAIRLTVNRAADRMCNIPAPVNGAEAKFSLRFAAALALAGRDTADPATFIDTVVADPELDRIRALTNVTLGPADWPDEVTEVTIETIDGRVLTQRHDMEIRPTMDQAVPALRRKFDALLRPLMGTDRIARLADEITMLEQAGDISGLPAALPHLGASRDGA